MDVGKVEDASSAPVTGGNMPPEEPIGDDGVNYDVYADSPAAHTTPSPETPEINFSSEDIQKREKTNYFVNIKDAEKHQREAERKHDAESRRKLSEVRRAEREAKRAEKAAAKERAKQQNYNSSEEKEALKKASAEERKHRKLARAERRKQRRLALKVRFAKFIAFLWVGKHKIFTIAAGVLLAAGIVVFFTIGLPYILEQQRLAAERTREEAELQADKDSTIDAANFSNYIDNLLYHGVTIEECSKKYEEEIEKSPIANKISLTIKYADFIYKNTNNTDSAIAIMTRASKLLETNFQREKYYTHMIYFYSFNNNQAAINYYTNLLKENSPELFENDGIGNE